LRARRAEYGAQILPTLSAELVAEFGNGFSARNLARMINFAESFPDEQTVAALSRELSWSHFIEIIPLQDELKRSFYWSVRQLRVKIDGMLYERTALSKKPARLIEQELKGLREADRLTPDLVFHDPYLLDFLGLSDAYSESWNWARGLPSSPGRSASRSAPMTSTSTCSSTTAVCGGWSRLN
jgi:hypothetical protein